MTTPHVLISILNWNNSVSTCACIDYILRSDYSNFDLVVIDNASIDNSVNEIKEAYPDIKLIELSSNEGYAGGHRHIIPLAIENQSELILLLNNDLLLQSDTLTKLVNAYIEYGEALYGAIPLQTFPEFNYANQEIRFPKKFLKLPYQERIFDFNPYPIYSDIFSDLGCRAVAAIPGSVMLIPLSVIQEHGFMDERFFMYSEEIDYCFRLRDEDIPSYLVPQAFIMHNESESSRKNAYIADLIWYYRIRNQLIRINRYETLWTSVMVLLKDFLLIIWQLFTGHPMASYYILRGIVDGLSKHLGKTYAPEKYL